MQGVSGLGNTTDENKRNYPDAVRVGAGAVIQHDGNILLIRRAKDPDKGKWSIPGGMVELGETLLEATVREVKEECSIDVEVERFLGPAEKIIFDKDGNVQYHFVIMHYQARFTGGTLRSGTDAAECRWVPMEELAEQDITTSLREFLTRYGIL